jgi:tetratricopeptide (TPR) repeat protein
MILPVRLRRLDAPLPTTGLFVLGQDAGVVVEAIAELGLPLPEVYPLPDGFLLRRTEPFTTHPPGTLRLREIAPYLFLPVDAELSPGLLDDEARALVRDQGLVFLPGGNVLGFDRASRAPLAELVSIGPVRRGAWQALPQGSRLPERIRVILDDRPTPAASLILEQSAGDIGSEEVPPPPDASTTGQAITGRIQAGFGNFFLWLGRLLNWRWLAQRGANLLRGAMQAVPRLAQNLLGRQQTALRELLREFREGNQEEALRRALPLTSNLGRGSTLAGDASLPTHTLRFNLGDLLATGGSGGSVWLTEADIQMQLAEEYRRAAREAATAGDFRRAAFIYGKLLGDLRLAADMLARGGMWQEAAILYLERVNDELSAARCFEQAGDIDRAVQLFRKNGAHVEAGDVLRRAGDEKGALAEYQFAADRLAERDRFAEAGDLFRDHVQRLDLAASYYQRGWRERRAAGCERSLAGGATHCVLRLLDLHARTNDHPSLLALSGEVADFYEEAGAESEAVQVFNTIVRLAEQTLPPAERESLRDRALVGLSRRLRQHAAIDQRSGGTVSLLFGRDGVWSPNVVADAEVAFRSELRTRKPTSGTTPHTVVPLSHGQPTAVAGSLNGEALFLGFDTGDVVRFVPETGTVHFLEQPHRTAIESLGTDETGRFLVLITGNHFLHYDASVRLSPAGLLMVSPSSREEMGLHRVSNLTAHADKATGIWWSPLEYRVFAAPLAPVPAQPPRGDSPTTGAAMLLLLSHPRRRPLALRFTYSKVEGFELGASATEPVAIDLGGFVPPPGERLAPIEVRLLPHANDGMPEFSVLDVDDEGRVWISDLRWLDRLYHLGSFHTRTGGYLAGALLGPTQAVGVLPDGIAWLRRDGHDLIPWTMSKVPLEDAVAVWVGWQASEVIVVRHRGDLVRVPRPR